MKTTASVYNLLGEKVSDLAINTPVFAVKPKESVVHQVVVAQMANARKVLAHTKTRGEVRGGGKKPWKQKGTGRARHGSIRSPLWVGGGITFGPLITRNFSKKVNKKMKQKALFMTLTDKFHDEKILFVQNFDLQDIKTKVLVALFEKLSCKDKKVLVILPAKNPEFLRAVRNIPKIKTVTVNSLNVIDVLHADYLLTSEEAVAKIRDIFHKLSLAESKS